MFFLAGCSEKKNEAGGNIQSAQKPFTEFLFVGMVNNNSGLYVYDAERKRIKNIWSAKNEKIIELNYSEDRSSAFFLTAGKFR
jgi:archaellum component FlaF (FlaF/FlaG flagellin family)